MLRPTHSLSRVVRSLASLAAAAAALAAAALHAQTSAPTGAIRGSVEDSTGGAVAGVRLTAIHEGTRARRMVESGGDGRFHVPNLPSGEYTLLLEAPGFAALRAGPIAVSAGQIVEQRLTIALAGVVEKMDVKEHPEAIEAASSTASVALGGERIEEAPARSRNYLNFVLAAPGVAPSSGAVSQRTMTGVRSPNGDSGFTFGGMRPRNNAILIDGMDNRDETTGGSRVAPVAGETGHRGREWRGGRGVTGAAPQYLLEQTARSRFTGGTLTLNRRLDRDLAFLAAYNFGRTWDDASDFDEHPLDPLDLRRDWSYSRQHQSHRLALSGLFELPVDDLDFAPAWIKEFFDDLSFAPIFTVGSGRPFNALLTTDAFGTGAFPFSARPTGMERNSYRMRGIASVDLRVMKTLRVMNDRALLQFGVEAFNLTNHGNTERVSPYFSVAGGARLGSFGRTLESLPARQLQFLTQFEF